MVANLAAQITRVASNGTVSTKVSWDVQNIGDGKAAGSFVTVLQVAKNNGPFAELGRYTRANLQPGASFHFAVNHNFTGVNKLRFRVETDATHILTERSNGNNRADSLPLQP